MKKENIERPMIGTLDKTYRVGPGASVALLLCWWILAWVLGSIIIMQLGGQLRLATVVQDVVMFILPAVMSLLIITSKPWRLMRADCWPSWRLTLIVIFTVVASVPMMNKIVALNEAFTFPQSLSGVEATLRAFEDLAQQMVVALIGEPTVAGLVVSILIIGVLTGIAEETFFRGALQPILHRVFRNGHAAVWTTALIFSAMHMEFFGLVPRLLLGAFLGYLAWWSGSLWLPVMAHALNNSLVVICMWSEKLTGHDVAISKLGEGATVYDWIGIAVSVVLTAWLIGKLAVNRVDSEQRNV